MDISGKNIPACKYLFKACCVLKDNKQNPYDNYDPENLYASVAAYEAIRIFISFMAANNLLLERADVDNAFL